MTMHIATKIALASAVALSAATPAAAYDFGGSAPPQVQAERRAALEAAQARWTNAAVDDYDFTLRRNCFCAPEYLGPVRIRVRNGVPHGGGKPFRQVNTIDKLFKVPGRNLDADGYRVRYGARLGIPRTIAIDPSLNVADEEIGYQVKAFRQR